MADLRAGDYMQRIADYVARNLKRGYTIAQLENALMKQGHSRVAIKRAITIASEKMPKSEIPTEPLPETKVITEEEKAEGKASTTNAGLAYILGVISGIIVLLNAKKEDKFTRFHALQSIFFNILTGLIFLIIYAIVAAIVSFGGTSWGKWSPTFYLVYWGIFELWMLLNLISAIKGNKKKLPVIGHLSENLS